MDHMQRLTRQVKLFVLFVVLIENALLVSGLWITSNTNIAPSKLLLLATITAVILSMLAVWVTSGYMLEPVRAIWDTVFGITHDDHHVDTKTNVKNLKVGKELVGSLSSQIEQLAAEAEHPQAGEGSDSTDLKTNFIATNLPLPLFVLNEDQIVLFANDPAGKYIGRPTEEIIGEEIYSVLDMSFPNNHTFDVWLKDVKENTVTSTKLWERVKLNVSDNQPTRLFDLAAYYNKDNPRHYETLLVLFDHTSQYSQDDQAISYIALSVHELRTPLAILRGYIEALEEELKGKLSPELDSFMTKMDASAQQLSAFVSNILNVARVDSDQLMLELHQENWSDILRSTVEMMNMRAGIRGVKLNCSIQENLPAVGADRISIQEVISNLIDNAVKYSGDSKEIKISTYLNSEGLIETVVQDYGVGIPNNVMANLFTKFYRDHKNRAQIGGTGLGLYLSKAIVTAHGGNIWVRSKEGEGSIFGFTLLPYDKLADEIKHNDKKDITRNAHGWIKNHSLYRR